MANKKKRRRTVPANIAQKTDREIMETVFGKRVLGKVDEVLNKQNEQADEVSTQGK
ncbi:hypothetical protein [Candidatus Palauibacter sp.]|uniref:hypothetical protein n=1 Tax=Candidatus Palauibacter sp. TaxID=3101350 RepID=UPI003B51D21C